MVAIPFGLSVHHFITSVGAEVGFASLIAVALLVLLFFSQARETATLRRRADEASQRIQELEAELADMADQVAALPAEISVRAASPRAAAAYGGVAPSPAVAAAAAGGAGMMLPPAAPAGVGAPALAAATRLIPDPDHVVPEYAPATAAGNGNGSGRPVVAASAATAERGVSGATTSPPRPVAAPVRAGGGAGAVAGAGAAQGTRPPQSRPGGPGQGRPGQGRPPGPGQGRPPGPGQAKYAGPARAPGAPMRPPARRSRGRIVLGVLLGIAALAAVVVGVLVLTGSKTPSSASHSLSSATLGSSHRSNSSAATVQPSTVTVSVLNGTDMQGLAGSVAHRLITAGYRKGSVANASDQTQANTIVAYMTPTDRPDAVAVATALKLGPSVVQLIDPNTKAIACPPSQPCPSAVVVIVGKNLAAQ